MSPVIVEAGRSTHWQLHGADTPADAATRQRQCWASRAQMPAPPIVHNMAWRAQVVYWLLAQPARWGVLAAELAPRLLAGSGRLRVAGVLEIVDVSGAMVERLDIATPRAAVAVRGLHLLICRDGARFGVWHAAGVDWGDDGLPGGALCHALMASACGGRVADVRHDDVRPMIELLPMIVCDAPDMAVLMWHDMMGTDTVDDRRGDPSDPIGIGGMVRRGALWAAGGVAAYTLGAAGAPLLAATCAGALEVAVSGEAIARLSRRQADPAERARFEAALALTLPALGCTDIRALMLRLEGADARLDFFHLTSTIRRRLAARSDGETVAGVIARLPVRDLERAARENDRRQHAPERIGSEPVLRTVLALAHEIGLLCPWGGAQEVSTEPYDKRVALWRAQLDAWDRQASDRLRVGIDHVTGNATRAVPAFGVTAHTHADAESPSGVSDPLLDTTIATTSAVMGAVLRRGPRFLAVKAGVVGLSVATVLVGTRYACEQIRSWLDSDVPIDNGFSVDAYRRGRAEPSHGLQDRLTLGQILTLYEWLAWADEDAGYDARARAYAALLLGNALARLGNGSAPANLPALLDAPLTVSLVENSFPVGGVGYGVGYGAMHTYKTFSLRDVALGQHFREEFLKIGGSRRVTSVSVSGDDADVAEVLRAVDSDAFRQALYDEDNEHLNRLSGSPAAIAAFSQYVNARAFHVVMQAKAAITDDRSGPVARQWGAEVDTTQTLQLVTFQRCVVAGLMAAVHDNGASALLISVKHGTWFWWDASIETSASFRDFMRSHLSIIERERLENPMRIDDLYFRIGPPPMQAEQCRTSPGAAASTDDEAKTLALALNPGLRSFMLSLNYFDADFKFLPGDAIQEQLWAAEMRCFRDNLDVKIVTKTAREQRDWEQVKQAMLQASGAFFPLLFGAFPGVPLITPIVLGGSLGSGVASLMSIAQSTENADLRELRKAHSDLKFGGMMLVMNFIPSDTRVSRVVGAAFSYSGTAARDIIKRGEAIVNAPPNDGKRPLSLLDERVQRFVREASVPGGRPSRVSELPWDTIARLRSASGGIDYLTSQRAVAVMDGLPWGFLGSRLIQVTTYSELLRLPPGFPIAFVGRDETMFLAGVTLGGGKIVGKSINDNNALLPTEFALLDFADDAMHAGILTFGRNGQVESDGETLKIFVDESIRELVPALPMPDTTVLRRAPVSTTDTSLQAGSPGSRPPSDATTEVAPGDGSTPAAIGTGETTTPERRPWERMFADPVRQWSEIVTRWRGDRGATVTTAVIDTANATPTTTGATRAPNATDAPNTTSTTTAPRRVPAVIFNAPASITLEQLWVQSDAVTKAWLTPAFAIAMAAVLARVETGLLLWHMPQLSRGQQNMARRHVQGNDSARTACLGEAPLYGVVALTSESEHLLLSLTTGEVLTWRGDRRPVGKPELQDFVSHHLSEYDRFGFSHLLHVDEGRDVTDDDVQINFPVSADRHSGLSQDLRDRLVSDLRCRAGVRRGCARDDSADDMLYLVAYAAIVLAPADRDALLDVVQMLRGPGARRGERPPYIYAFDREVRGGHNGPDLPFAHFLGQRIEGFAADAFRRLPGSRTLAQTAAFARRFTEEQLPHYAWHLAHGDIGALVESGIDDDAFGYAMSVAGRAARNGRFAAAISATLGQIRRGMPERRTSGSVRAFAKITDKATLCAIAPGYRLFVGESSAYHTGPELLYEMITLGNGTVAAWDRTANESAPALRLQRLDLAGENELIRFTRDGIAWVGGGPAGLWTEGDVPGVFSEPRCAWVSEGGLDGRQLLQELAHFPIVNRAFQRHADGGDPDLLEQIRLQLGAYDVRNAQVRVLLSWSAPWQCKPDKSFIVIAEAKANGKLRPDCAPCRVVVDLFAARTLGQGEPSVGYVVSESEWRDVYRARAGERCLKYIDFNNAAEALDAAHEYDTLPGVGPYDYRHGAILLHMPDWRRYPPPGWHPSRGQ
ncbi:hypothetical protein PIN31009_03033 [Pandoraea iniqua]|uniref:hypothetical protein n=1 Tax=Pandoraea iniqua TaxID=2508288 RepID=UPI00124148C5|nr:hypothetical protein [Pandoraea iniqua]VVE19022.1 hypothetical protein PIN31009_03033 [Pandoraea iniqua]